MALSSRSSLLGYNTDGSSSTAKWNSSSADVSATVHINDRLRLVETFGFGISMFPVRFSIWRTASSAPQVEGPRRC